MAGSAALVDVLKRELKARGITYARAARELGMSEASVKRMFSRKNFTLKRLDAICRVAHLEFSELTRTLNQEETQISQLTPEQEKEIVANKKLFLVAVCALNHVTFEQIVNAYDIPRAECIQLLMRLDRLKFIELQPNNRIRLLVSRTFSWLPDGPIQRFFNQQAHNEYFRSRFDRPEEFMVVVNGMLSKTSSAAIVTRLKRVAREFSELHNEDMRLPLAERSAMSLLVAIRHWELQAFAEMRRRKK
ncbi:MAG: transcriptional regulator [Betaproteobacteria bacterium RIFCSPLOWO2_12_FULL_62_58]|nr:MAG: transcriptional regulator [Betaproteobacteria bacterium RIFCSPLOWO2_12_FULL_62_58]